MQNALNHVARLSLLAMLILLVGSSVGFAPAHSTPTNGVPKDVTRWKAGQRLTWKDFKGPVERGTYMDAMTESGIVFNWSCDWSGFEIEAYAIFDHSKSWVRKSDASPYLLKHEQLHFDITELHARKLRKLFAEHPNPCRLGRGGITRLAQQVYDASAAMQNQYDHDTRHSKNKAEQERWEKKIRRELAAYSAFAEKKSTAHR